MTIRYSCPVCDARFKAPDHKAGAKGDCPKCGQRLQVPAAPARGRTVLGRAEPVGADTGPAVELEEAWELARPEPEDDGYFPPPKPHSGFGLLSFFVAVVNVAVACLAAGWLAWSASRAAGPLTDRRVAVNLAAVAFVLILLSPFALVGILFGAAGHVAGRSRKQVFSDLGLLGNFAVLGALLTLYAVGLSK